METVISSVITGSLALLGVVMTNIMSNKRIEYELQKNQAVTETKIEELTREVREHNNFARRIPVLEDKVSRLEREVERN